MKLAEEQQREKAVLRKKIVHLDKQLDAKQASELEIEALRGKVNVAKHMEGDGDGDKNGVDRLQEDLKEKEEELEDMEALNQTLIIKERKRNDELQESRNELISGSVAKQVKGNVRVKRMGDLDIQTFLKATKLKYKWEAAEEKAIELCSLWEEHIRYPSWQPFEVITVDGKHRSLRNEYHHCLFARCPVPPIPPLTTLRTFTTLVAFSHLLAEYDVERECSSKLAGKGRGVEL